MIKIFKMKKLLFFSCLILITTTGFGQNVKALDAKYGFREAIFETPKSAFKNLVESEKNIFTSTTENLNLGNYKLFEVAYKFYKGQLEMIMIKTKGLVNSKGVLKIFQTAYGMGYQEKKYVEKYLWRGEKVQLIYEQNSITHDANITLWSKKLMNLEDLEKKKSNAEAAKKLL